MYSYEGVKNAFTTCYQLSAIKKYYLVLFKFILIVIIVLVIGYFDKL